MNNISSHSGPVISLLIPSHKPPANSNDMIAKMDEDLAELWRTPVQLRREAFMQYFAQLADVNLSFENTKPLTIYEQFTGKRDPDIANSLRISLW
jgi:hypothetical protein